MSEQLVNTGILWWNPPIEEETSPTVNLLPQYYLVSPPPSLVNETPGVVVSDYFIQSSTSGTPIELSFPNRTDSIPSPPLTLSDRDMTSNEVFDNQPNRRSRQRPSPDDEARIARRRERNRLAARRFRDRSRNYYNQLEQRVLELEAEVTRLKDLLDCKR
jgi:hypothetical protein